MKTIVVSDKKIEEQFMLSLVRLYRLCFERNLIAFLESGSLDRYFNYKEIELTCGV